MRRSLAAATIIAALSLQAFPASASTGGRVVLVTVDGTRLSDWNSSALPGFGSIMRDGAIGLLSTRTAEHPVAAGPARAAAYRTLGAGRVSTTASPRTLGIAARPVVIIGPSDSPARMWPGQGIALPAVANARTAGTSEMNAGRTKRLVERALGSFRFVVVDTGGADLVRVDSFLAGLRPDLGSDDTLIVASLTPPPDRLQARRYLAAVAIVGPGLQPGLLTSASTERDGVVTIPDLSRTILDRLGAHVPTSMTGRSIRVAPNTHAIDDLSALERDLVHASIVRGPLLRATVYAGSAALVMALITILAGMSGGVASRWRALLDTILIAVTAVPLLLMLEPLAGNASLARTAVALAVVALAGSFALRQTVGSRRALIGILAATALVIVGDLVFGGGLAERSPLSYLLVEGARFHGIGNEAMGVTIAASLFSVTALLDAGLTRRRLAASAVILALVAIVMGAPEIGDKFGSVPAAVPAFALFIILASGRRFDVRAALGIALLTVLAAGIVVAVDRAGGGTHIARVAGAGSGEIIGRKAGAASRLLAFSYWMTAIVASVGTVALLAWRRSALIGRALWGRPGARRALVCCGVAIAGSVAANDAGVIAAAWIGLFGGATLMSAMLTPDRS